MWHMSRGQWLYYIRAQCYVQIDMKHVNQIYICDSNLNIFLVWYVLSLDLSVSDGGHFQRIPSLYNSMVLLDGMFTNV